MMPTRESSNCAMPGTVASGMEMGALEGSEVDLPRSDQMPFKEMVFMRFILSLFLVLTYFSKKARSTSAQR